jgi:chaperonin cofactor prefoldin
MEISRQQFEQKISLVEKAIKECDVIAIDTELSGILEADLYKINAYINNRFFFRSSSST